MKIVVCVKHVPDATADRTFTEDGTTDRRRSTRCCPNSTSTPSSRRCAWPSRTPTPRSAISPSAPTTHATPCARRWPWAVTRRSMSATRTSRAATRSARHWCWPRRSSGTASISCCAGWPRRTAPWACCRRCWPSGSGVPAVTHLEDLAIEDGTVTGPPRGRRRDRTDPGRPARRRLGDGPSGDARYPSFKGIMAAKKKPVETLGLADLGIEAAEVGPAGARSAVDTAARRPPRTKGEIVADEGTGGVRTGRVPHRPRSSSDRTAP